MNGCVIVRGGLLQVEQFEVEINIEDLRMKKTESATRRVRTALCVLEGVAGPSGHEKLSESWLRKTGSENGDTTYLGLCTLLARGARPTAKTRRTRGVLRWTAGGQRKEKVEPALLYETPGTAKWSVVPQCPREHALPYGRTRGREVLAQVL
ncbi:hypothetical protein NDU88_003643 [Pleurodeles waltl]|uniref:Uncharacterized protein n=1 Tax=Pleurodeles waltl TaxID=8319 RepID=A0AAV7QDN4_PLEWA|nr:hypothetical protein NDU88_003643 [Pleurodeles waltl]